MEIENREARFGFLECGCSALKVWDWERMLIGRLDGFADQKVVACGIAEIVRTSKSGVENETMFFEPRNVRAAVEILLGALDSSSGIDVKVILPLVKKVSVQLGRWEVATLVLHDLLYRSYLGLALAGNLVGQLVGEEIRELELGEVLGNESAISLAHLLHTLNPARFDARQSWSDRIQQQGVVPKVSVL